MYNVQKPMNGTILVCSIKDSAVPTEIVVETDPNLVSSAREAIIFEY